MSDLPIALRRTRRSSTAPREAPEGAHMHKSETLHVSNVNVKPSVASAGASTPSRGTKKRVRFSDPGPSTEQEFDDDNDNAQDNATSSTGLTPHIRRTTLEPGSGSKRRRHSGPANLGRPDAFDSTIDTARSGEVNFLPLRQVLDGRVKRRIRRNGLSEEINIITAQKRRKAQQTKAKMDALRAEVATKDAEIRRLSGVTEVGEEDEASIDDLKTQVEQLRRTLQSPALSPASEDGSENGSTRVEWTMAARDPFSGEYSAMDIDYDDDDEFGESTIADLACSTPSRRASNARNSFPTPPSTSPDPGPVTPCHRRNVTSTSHAAVQVTIPDAEKRQLEEELASLQLEIAKLTSTLETYEGMASRLSDRLSPFAPKNGSAEALIMNSRSPTVKIEAQLNNLLQAFSDRTAALTELKTSIDELGFPGNDAHDVIGSLSTAFRTARLELEYLSPGEITLPLTSAGAAVLDLLLTRLRELARQSLENEDAIDEYHSLELSLRKQLSARVEAMDGMKKEMGNLEVRVKAKDTHIRELEVGIERLKGAVKSYTRDVSELERLVQRLEGNLDKANKHLRKARDNNHADVEEWSGVLKDKESAITELEEKLGLALEQTSELKDQVASLQSRHTELRARHKDELASLNKQHGAALALRDSRVSELRLEVGRINETLRTAHETVQKLRVENGSLSSRLDAEKSKAKAAIDTMQSELERVVRMGQDLMTTPRKNAKRG